MGAEGAANGARVHLLTGITLEELPWNLVQYEPVCRGEIMVPQCPRIPSPL